MNDRWLKPSEVAEVIPGMTPNFLRKLRFTGQGPRYLNPTPRTILYSESALRDWVLASERTQTSKASA